MDTPNRNRRLVLGNLVIPIGGVLSGNQKGITAVCPLCGECWGRAYLGTTGHYMVARWPCAAHGNPSFLGGSFLRLLAWWGDFGNKTAPTVSAIAPFLSDEYLRYEALLMTKFLLNESPIHDYF